MYLQLTVQNYKTTKNNKVKQALIYHALREYEHLLTTPLFAKVLFSLGWHFESSPFPLLLLRELNPAFWFLTDHKT